MSKGAAYVARSRVAALFNARSTQEPAMNLRPFSSLTIVAIAVGVIVCFGVFRPSIPNTQAQEVTTDASVAYDSSIQDRIELAEIRLAIRLQDVQLAKTERRLLIAPATNDAEMLRAAKQKLLAAENRIASLDQEFEKDVPVGQDLVRVQAAELDRQAAKNILAKLGSELSANNDKLTVHDERIKLLELRAKLAQTKLNQLKRRLK
jgi:hypothetical protein